MDQVLFYLLVAGICFFLAYLISPGSKTNTAEAKKKYEEALKNGDRIEALKWGRLYFESLRWLNGYNLTIYDEQRIQNDINVYCK